MSPRARLRCVRRLTLGIALFVVAAPGKGLPGVSGTTTGAEAAHPTPSGRPGTMTTFPALPVLPAPAAWPEPSVIPRVIATADAVAPPPPPALAPLPIPDPTPAPAPPGPTRPPAIVAHLPATGIPVYPGPATARPSLTLGGQTEFGNPRVLLTTTLTATGPGGPGEERIEVHLPTRPNGETGWIPRASIVLTEVHDRITVDLSARSVTWTRGAELLGQVVAAVGAPGTPTPPGTYFVTDVLSYAAVGATSPAGEYGPWVVALDGYSEAFTTFRDGEPRLAIHGTNVPTSLGTASSAGCIRIATNPLHALAAGVPPGTPVVVVP